MSRFAQLAQELLHEEYADAPVWATHLGIDGYDDQLDDLSAATFAARRKRAAAWLARLTQLGPDTLDNGEGLDREHLISVLRGRTIMADWEMWRRQPDTYLTPGLGGVFTLFLHRLKPEAELARAAAARLRQVPRNIADGKQNLDPELMPRLYLERALGQARAAVRYARDLVPAEVQDAALRSDLAAAGAVAAAAFEDFVNHLESLRDRASGEWAIGEERYTRLLREKEMLPYDTRSLRQRGQQEYDRLATELTRCAEQIAGTSDWVEVLKQLNQDHPTTPEAMQQSYAEWTARARDFLQERHLVTFLPGDECSVEPSPPFQRPVLAVASYQSPPPFSPATRGHFFVPFPPDGASDEEIQQRLEGNSYPSIPTTAVHEAYPGHHWQLVMAKQNPSVVGRSFRTSYFSEGWALYAEQMMREQGFFTDPRHEMCQYEATIFRAARIVVDTSLHSGEMTYDEAVRFMMERANLPEPTAKAEVSRYCAWPTQASAYLTGCLEILRIRERYFQQRGSSDTNTLRAFHDRLATTGGPPLGLAERAVLGEN